MNTAQHPDVQLADGFHVTDHLDAPYRLAREQWGWISWVIVTSNLDGEERRQLLGQDVTRSGRTTCFSPDGSTLYGYDTRFWRMEVAMGATQTLPDIPFTSPFSRIELLECSSDNSTLLLKQTTPMPASGHSKPPRPTRLCRISTQGTDFRILYEDLTGKWAHNVVCCWEQGFAVVQQWNQATGSQDCELVNLDLNTGERTLLCPSVPFGWKLALRPDLTKLAWSSTDNEIYTYSFRDGVTRLIPLKGNCLAWSPDGRYLAYMRDETMLCLWSMERGSEQQLAWFAPSPYSEKPRGGYVTTPVWPPDGRLLRFTLSHRHKEPLPHTRKQILYAAKCVTLHALYNRNPFRTTNKSRYFRRYMVMKTGIADFHTRQVLLSDNWDNGVKWLPHPAAEHA